MQKKKKIVLLDKQMITPIHKQLEEAQVKIRRFLKEDLGVKDPQADTDFMVLGQHKSFVPDLGEILWKQENSHHYAYIFQKDGKKIGYIRIPTYAVFDDEYLEFENIIRKFQVETDALVIDQLNNPGGSVFYLFSLLSMLSDYSLELPPERITITQRDVSDAFAILEDPFDTLSRLIEGVFGFSISSEEIANVTAYFQTIIDEWNNGHFFTNPIHLYGLTSIQPNPKIHYTKPILVLVNYLDFSCADFFPAILQDNHRAKVFGTKTAGAGGFVLDHEFPNFFGVNSFTYTGSIAYRTNNRPIENLGVSPDFPYELTSEDLLNGYKGYVKAIHQALEAILNVRSDF